MERQIDLREISDGKKYRSRDMVRLGCNDCEGCSDCCRETGESIVLDPWDIFMLEGHLGRGFASLLGDCLELHVVDGVVLPNLRLRENRGGCVFLSGQGRCTIHPFRPGFCRLFPLGRLYEDGGFTYFLQTRECKKERQTKVKISKWLGIAPLEAYERFIVQWHYLLREIQQQAGTMPEEELKRWSLYFLQEFYQRPYRPEDFYGQFAVRYEEAKRRMEEGRRQ